MRKWKCWFLIHCHVKRKVYYTIWIRQNNLARFSFSQILFILTQWSFRNRFFRVIFNLTRNFMKKYVNSCLALYICMMFSRGGRKLSLALGGLGLTWFPRGEKIKNFNKNPQTRKRRNQNNSFGSHFIFQSLKIEIKIFLLLPKS